MVKLMYPDPKPKFRPGDVVRLVGQRRRVYPVVEGVIACEYDPMPCMTCPIGNGCYEWANVLLTNGSWAFHVGECEMEFAELGQGLRDDYEMMHRRYQKLERFGFGAFAQDIAWEGVDENFPC